VSVKKSDMELWGQKGIIACGRLKVVHIRLSQENVLICRYA
jgi:hypothetical protein